MRQDACGRVNANGIHFLEHCGGLEMWREEGSLSVVLFASGLRHIEGVTQQEALEFSRRLIWLYDWNSITHESLISSLLGSFAD